MRVKVLKRFETGKARPDVTTDMRDPRSVDWSEHNVGDVVTVERERGEMLVAKGWAELADSPSKATDTADGGKGGKGADA